MKLLVRDFLFGMAAGLVSLILINWMNAPDYKGCARLQGQTLCYTLNK